MSSERLSVMGAPDELPENERLDDSQDYDEAPRRHGTLWGGAVLILLGVIFLLRQSGQFQVRNWWALFILIPAIGSFGTAYTLWQRRGRVTAAVFGSIYGGLYPLVVALIFLLDLRWSIYWPVFVILPGLGALYSGLLMPAFGERLRGRLYRPWLGWFGVSATLLGLAFLLRNLGWFDPAQVLPNWWGLFILLPALGGLLTTVRLAQQDGFGRLAVGSLVVSLLVVVVGVVALLGISWTLLTPMMLIVIGIGLLVGLSGSDR